jgi:hypothetical protein
MNQPENVKHLIEAIEENTEWLSTAEGDEVECIGIENLEGILSAFLQTQIKISQQ